MFTYTIFLVNIFNSHNLLIINCLYFHKWLILAAPQWVITPPYRGVYK